MIKKIALFLLALLPIGMMAQETKLGHINSQEILSLMPERTEIEKKLSALQDEWEKQLVKSREEYNAKVKEFIDKQATMSESIKQARQAEIADMEQRINTLNQTAQADIGKKYQELSAPMIEKVKKAIDAVGAEGNFTYIFDMATQIQMIVYQSPKSIDVTPLLKKKLNLTSAPAKPAETKPGK